VEAKNRVVIFIVGLLTPTLCVQAVQGENLVVQRYCVAEFSLAPQTPINSSTAQSPVQRRDIKTDLAWRHKFNDQFAATLSFTLCVGDREKPVNRDDWIYTPNIGLTPSSPDFNSAFAFRSDCSRWPMDSFSLLLSTP
jgi:hypothetical protein